MRVPLYAMFAKMKRLFSSQMTSIMKNINDFFEQSILMLINNYFSSSLNLFTIPSGRITLLLNGSAIVSVLYGADSDK